MYPEDSMKRMTLFASRFTAQRLSLERSLSVNW